MQDEYGSMTCEGHIYTHPTPYQLENGKTLEQAQLCYQTYGNLNASRDNVLVVCHALTGNASLHAWWGDMLGPGKAFDTDQYFIVCCNILGSCYGSTNPTSINPLTGEPYGKDFPDISVQDTVRLQLIMLQEALKISSVLCVIGGSFGGMQTLEYCVQAGTETGLKASSGEGPFVRSAVVIACGASHTAWQIGISECQRQAIYADPYWNSDEPMKATNGLSVARQIGMFSYRTPKGYRQHFGRTVMSHNSGNGRGSDITCYGGNTMWSVKSYLEYQGQKFLSRFDPVTYVKLTEQMDSHDISRGREGNILDVLNRVKIPVSVMGIDSDVLYPIEEQQEIAEGLPNGELCVIHSDDGHDGFLLEQEQVSNYIIQFLASEKVQSVQPQQPTTLVSAHKKMEAADVSEGKRWRNSMVAAK